VSNVTDFVKKAHLNNCIIFLKTETSF